MSVWYVLTHPLYLLLDFLRFLSEHPSIVLLALLVLSRMEAMRWRRVATTDALTGVGNRRRADQRLAQARGHMVAVLLDIDHFKRYNDTHGHLAGDELLRKIGAILRRHVRRGDLVARWGGEEFLLIFSGMALPAAEATVERLRGAIRESTGVTVSAGIAVRERETALAAVDHADKALYRAKEDRNRQIVWKGEAA